MSRIDRTLKRVMLMNGIVHSERKNSNVSKLPMALSTADSTGTTQEIHV